MTTKWNDFEDDALMGLPMMARVLYLQGLRRHMDYATGIVGIKRGISYQSLSEVLFIEPSRGRQNHGSPTQKSIRFAIDLLVRAGLVESRSADRRLIYHLPLADADQSAPGNRGRRRAEVGHMEPCATIGIKFSMIGESGACNGADPAVPNRGTPPTSVNRIESENDRARERDWLAGILAREGLTVPIASSVLDQWLAARYTENEYIRAIEKARRYKPEPTVIPPAYLDAILVNHRSQCQERNDEQGNRDQSGEFSDWDFASGATEGVLSDT
jgi:hypothetical protein